MGWDLREGRGLLARGLGRGRGMEWDGYTEYVTGQHGRRMEDKNGWALCCPVLCTYARLRYI